MSFKLSAFKDFQSDQIQRSSHKIFTARYASRNATLNLTPVTGTTNGFIFQIINSLIESWGVRLTCLDCKFLFGQNVVNKSEGLEISYGLDTRPFLITTNVFHVDDDQFEFQPMMYGRRDNGHAP